MSMQFTTRIPARTFGFESDKTVLGFLAHTVARPKMARTVPVDPDHVFDVRFFERLRLWWEWHDTRSRLFISGPSGCGKTSTVMQFLARVNAPVISITCRQRMDKSDFIGQWGMQEGKFQWFDGPASVAWRYGCVLVINEFSLAPPEIWVALNDLFEGDALTNARRGEVIPRHPNARIIITDNIRCCDPQSAMAYRDRHVQDPSSAERFWHLTADWIDADAEKRLLTRRALAVRATPDFDVAPWVEAATALAAHTRSAEGVRIAGNRRVPALSTRVLIRLVEIIVRTLSEGSPCKDVLKDALDLAIAQALSVDAAAALQEMAHFDSASAAANASKKRSR